jgi:hypothetical protein
MVLYIKLGTLPAQFLKAFITSAPKIGDVFCILFDDKREQIRVDEIKDLLYGQLLYLASRW